MSYWTSVSLQASEDMDKPSIIKIRIFGNKTCHECRKQSKAFDIHSIEYDFIDADADENEKLADQQNVDALPHSQAYDLSTGRVIYQKVGFVSPASFLSGLASALEALDRPTNLEIEGARRISPARFVPTQNKQRGCKGCNDVSKDS